LRGQELERENSCKDHEGQTPFHGASYRYSDDLAKPDTDFAARLPAGADFTVLLLNSFSIFAIVVIVVNVSVFWWILR
jgi:hypothetical protein